MSDKVSDEWAVPLCFTHHRALHTIGNEEGWWAEKGIDARTEALGLWHQSHGQPEPTQVGLEVREQVPKAGSGAREEDPSQATDYPRTHSVLLPDSGGGDGVETKVTVGAVSLS